MAAKTTLALAALFVVSSVLAASAQSDGRSSHRGSVRRVTPPATFDSRNATDSRAVKPFTEEERVWFNRASRVY
jgi:hypothetical protein